MVIINLALSSKVKDDGIISIGFDGLCSTKAIIARVSCHIDVKGANKLLGAHLFSVYFLNLKGNF